jgi:hypothetical protein
MRIVLAVVLLFFLDSTHAKSPSSLSSVTGLWQFGQHTVWIQIDQDGAAYQCRIASSGTVYASKGTASFSSIHWQQIWGTDRISIHIGSLVLKGLYGSFEYHTTSQPMGSACLAARQRSNISSKRTRAA